MAIVFLVLSVLLTLNNAQNPLQPPIQIKAPAEQNGTIYVNLTVKPHNATVRNAKGEAVATLTIRAYEYNGNTSFIGPTFHAKPGDTINVKLINELVGVGRLDKIRDNYNLSLPNATSEAYKDPDVTNLHTHGLHVDPRVDNVLKWTLPECPETFTDVKGNIINIESEWDKLDCYNGSNPAEKADKSSHDYPYFIPNDHYPGTHWYHAHWHGSVTFDVIQGLYGLFIIDDNATEQLVDDDHQIQLLMGFAWLHDAEDCKNLTNVGSDGAWNCKAGENEHDVRYTRPNQTSTAYPFQFPVTSACFVTCKMLTENAQIPIAGHFSNYSQLLFSDIGVFPVHTSSVETARLKKKGIQLFFVNGQVHPTVSLNPGEWYQFRMVNTVMNYLLFWARNETRIKPNCNFYVMGQDGVYFQPRPRNLFASPYIDRKVVLQPGARADLAVQCQCPMELANKTTLMCSYEIWASARFEVDGVDGFAPVPENDELLLIIEVPYRHQNESLLSELSWTPPSYEKTPYLNPTLDTWTDARCANTSFSGMTQCNIVHGRGKYPAGEGCPANGFPQCQVAMNQVQFSHTKVLAQVCVGDPDPDSNSFPTHEWMVTSNFHPFHHHTWPFQLQRNVTNGFIAMQGDWRDTMGAAGTFRMRSNYQVNDFFVNGKKFDSSKLIMHCHYVPHEDHGMMAQVGLLTDCSSIENKYIIPDETLLKQTTDGTTITNEYAIITTCPKKGNIKKAVTILDLEDVAGRIDVNVTVSPAPTCEIEFEFAVQPRNETVGNLWIGIGIDKDLPPAPSNLSVLELEDFLNSRTQNLMNGDALIVSIYATQDPTDPATQQPLNKTVAREVTMNATTRTAISGSTNRFDCSSFMANINGEWRFKCTRAWMDDGWGVLFDEGNRYFTFAYGEGVFQDSKTYHSSRGGCTFKFDVNHNKCSSSQNKIKYEVGPGGSIIEPSLISTTMYTTNMPSIAPTKTEADNVNNLSCFLSIIVITALSILSQ